MESHKKPRIPFVFPNERFANGREYMHTVLLSKDLDTLHREVGILLDRHWKLTGADNKIERKTLQVKLEPARTSTDLFFIRFVILLCICDDEDAVIGITGNTGGLGREWYVILETRNALAMFSRQTTITGTKPTSISEIAYKCHEQVVLHAAMCFIQRRNYRRRFETDYEISSKEQGCFEALMEFKDDY